MAVVSVRTWLLVLLLATCGAALASEPRFAFDPPRQGDDAATRAAIAALSVRVLAAHAAGQADVPAAGLAHLQLVAGRDRDAADGVRALVDGFVSRGEQERARRWVPYLVYARARADRAQDFDQAYPIAFAAWFEPLDDLEAQRTQFWFGGDLERARHALRDAVSRLGGAPEIALADALGLAGRQAFVDMLAAASAVPALIEADNAARYAIDEDVLIRTPQGATLSAVVVRSRRATQPLPAAMQFTIYTIPRDNLGIAMQAAAHGYAGVVVDARGKRLSTDEIAPYEHEVDDTHAAIDWISRQPWSDGRVAMYGGSYSGFAAWAAAKRMHPALKTIVPYVAAVPGHGLPMENNVFLLANYAWPFYVAGNRLLDDELYAQRERWQNLARDWFRSGRPYREVDRIDGKPNPLLQRWLSHPAYDGYWQSMVPYGADFARIDIPVLSITGYYDDGQLSALHYFREHYRHRPDARHVLVIGPYDHFGAQQPVKARTLSGYDIDPVAQFDTQELTFQWLDHVLHGTERPALLRDTVNYQLMGANTWGGAASLESAAVPAEFHLTAGPAGPYHLLSRQPVEDARPLRQRVDFADREAESHPHYPYPIVRDAIAVESGFAFASAPFPQPVSVIGGFSGELKLRIDRRDVDVVLALYELMADGRAMQLSYHVGRASHARDMATRELLTPGEWTVVPIERTRMTARRMEAGSRLLLVVDVLKSPLYQVNHGSGKDVSDESIEDAGAPLTVEWHPDSVVRIPLLEDASP